MWNFVYLANKKCTQIWIKQRVKRCCRCCQRTKKEKRENHEHFCIIYWKFVAHRQWQQWGIVWEDGKMAKEHAERQNCMKCVSILPCTVHTAAPSPAAPLRHGCLPACPRHYPLACVHLFFICMNFSLFSQTQSANGANCTSRSAGSAQTRDICQWEISSKINLQHRQKQCPTIPLPRLLSVFAVLSCRIETSTMWQFHRPRCIPKVFALAKLGIQTNILLL